MNLFINSKRESGVELLKILALFGIVLCHVYNSFAYAIDCTNNLTFFDTHNLNTLEYLAFQIIITFGYLGNTIFFVCSSWYLVDSNQNKKEKIIYFIINAILISLFFFCLNLGNELTKKDLLNSILPITNGVYWYITCYIIFYFIYPYINKSLNNLTKREHFSLAFWLFVVYFIYSYLFKEDIFYINKLISFISTFVIVSYLKKYKTSLCDDTRINLFVFVFTSFIFYLLIFINFAITPINIVWHKMNNPFFLLMSISLLNIFRQIRIKSHVINTISAMSLFVYMFHSNDLFKRFTIDKIASFIMGSTGLKYIVLKVIFFTIILFMACIAVSLVYYKLLNNTINKISLIVKNKVSIFIEKMV